MNTLVQSSVFAEWLGSLKDEIGKARILHRMAQATLGNFGDCKPVGDGISEMRVQYGRGTGFISCGMAQWSMSCFVAAINPPRTAILPKRSVWPRS